VGVLYLSELPDDYDDQFPTEFMKIIMDNYYFYNPETMDFCNIVYESGNLYAQYLDEDGTERRDYIRSANILSSDEALHIYSILSKLGYSIFVAGFRHGENDWDTAIEIAPHVTVNRLGIGIFVNKLDVDIGPPRI